MSDEAPQDYVEPDDPLAKAAELAQIVLQSAEPTPLPTRRTTPVERARERNYLRIIVRRTAADKPQDALLQH